MVLTGAGEMFCVYDAARGGDIMGKFEARMRKFEKEDVAEFVRILATPTVAGSGGFADGPVFSCTTIANRNPPGLDKTSQLSHDAFGIIPGHLHQ